MQRGLACKFYPNSTFYLHTFVQTCMAQPIRWPPLCTAHLLTQALLQKLGEDASIKLLKTQGLFSALASPTGIIFLAVAGPKGSQPVGDQLGNELYINWLKTGLAMKQALQGLSGQPNAPPRPPPQHTHTPLPVPSCPHAPPHSPHAIPFNTSKHTRVQAETARTPPGAGWRNSRVYSSRS